MKIIDEPKVFLLGETAANWEGIEAFTSELGAPDWDTDTEVGAEVISEIAGRSCYKSFAPGLNPNVKRVREGNAKYLRNIITSKHGSVLEHGDVILAFVGVSRVFTHELVRHRAGTAFSQESLRYVRLDALCAWYPESFGEEVIGKLYDALAKKGKMPLNESNKEAWVLGTTAWLKYMFNETFTYLENIQKTIGKALYLDELDGDFHVKKQITSAMRRLAPIGLGTGIVFKSNHRNMRHIIEQRTSLGAEEEIRLVFFKVARLMKDRYPNIYQDMELNEDGTVTFTATKI